jgi:hypothetical protein
MLQEQWSQRANRNSVVQTVAGRYCYMMLEGIAMPLHYQSTPGGDGVVCAPRH